MSMPSRAVRTPKFAPSRAASATSPACSSALVGMQPRWRQVPPSLSFSTRATDRPSCAARKAAAYPPLPPPSTRTSKESVKRISQVLWRLTEAILSLARRLRPRTPATVEVGENVFVVVPLAVPSPDGPRDREERFVAFFRRRKSPTVGGRTGGRED